MSVTLDDRMAWTRTEREKARALAPALEPWLATTLCHIKRGFGVYGWESFGYREADLERLGLIRGEWMGSLDMDPRPRWTVTELGRKVVEELELAANLQEQR